MDTWQFFQNEKGEWCWKHVAESGLTAESHTCFVSRTDCIADAMRHGYLARSPGMQRRGTATAMPWRRPSLMSRS